MADDRHVRMAEAVMEAVAACRAALVAVDRALIVSNELGVATFGYLHLQVVRQPLSGVIAEHGPCVALSVNEIEAWRKTHPGPEAA